MVIVLADLFSQFTKIIKDTNLEFGLKLLETLIELI